MKRFIKKILFLSILIICFLFALIYVGYFFIGDQYLDGYNASLTDKINRLVNINEPKIILVGNSNLAFGIDSKQIENETGYKVVNLGLHGGLGNPFHEEMAKFNISSGDLVIICHTDYSDDDMISDNELAWQSIGYNLKLWKILRIKDIPNMVLSYPKYLASSIKRKTNNNKELSEDDYERKIFNEYGDVVKRSDISCDISMYSEYEIHIPSINDTCINRLNKLNQYVVSKGAKMAVASYPIINGNHTPSREEYSSFSKLLDERLECDVISDFGEYLIDYTYFYDTQYHLTAEGVQIRTSLLINDINNWIE